MAGESEEKSLPPSEKKLREARKKGQVPKSKDLVSAAVTLASVGFISMQMDSIFSRFVDLFGLASRLVEQPKSEGLSVLVPQVVATAAYIVVPFLGLMLLSAVMASIISTGGPALSFDPIMPKPQKLNPMEGFKKLVGIRGLLEVLKSIFKLSLIATISFQVIRGSFHALVELPSCGLRCAGPVFHATLTPLIGGGVIIFLAFGLADMGLQRWLFIRDQRMSLTEKKMERKNSDGNPLIRNAHKRERREASQVRAGLTEATFIVTGTRIAVALRYSLADTKVPISVARAEAEDLANFIGEARRLNLPSVHNPLVAREVLNKVEIGKRIPRELFQAVIDCMKQINVTGK